MKINFNRRKVESISIFSSLVLILTLVFFGVFAVADNLFSWDILSENLEKIAILLLSATGMVIAATFLISLVINFSIISISLEKISSKIELKPSEDE
jgi:uncharacterized membrane protein YpjA